MANSIDPAQDREGGEKCHSLSLPPPGSSQHLLLLKLSWEAADSGTWGMYPTGVTQMEGKDRAEGKTGPAWDRVHI